MGEQFHWEAETEFDEAERPLPASRQRPFRFGQRWRRVTAVLLFCFLAGWLSIRARLLQTEAQLRRDIQTILDLETAAYQRGDGDLFFATMSDDPAWRAAHLLPLNQAVYRAGPTVTAARLQEDEVWATITWVEGGQSWQHAAFFRRQDGQLLHVPTSARFWGEWQRQEMAWGVLTYRAADGPLATAVADFVSAQIVAYCPDGCADKLPLMLALRDDNQETAVPYTLHIPSPRLIALDEAGQPAPAFWQELQRRLEGYLTPVHLRFALPPPNFLRLHPFDYAQIAAAFMAQHPDISVELVTLDELPTDPFTLAQFDGAAILPTAEMIAAGLVVDLTDFAATDPDFRPGDFYAQIWQGAQWQGRMWVMPQAAALKLIFYNESAYRNAGLAFPSLRWTWDELTAQLTGLDAAYPYGKRPSWQHIFFDESRDMLFAYAYNQSRCANNACLSPDAVAAAFTWYRQIVVENRYMPDLAALPAVERDNREFGWGLIWVNDLVYYEHRLLLLGSMGVTPFPGTEQFDGISPLWLHGSYISRSTRYPGAMWTWLKFLSDQPSLPRYRLIPARPSVAAAIRYWQILPRPLNEALRAAFPFARAVPLDEQDAFSWGQLAAVLSGQVTPEDAAQQRPPLRWFTQ